jgi:molybdate transport system ATP-binding protein
MSGDSATLEPLISVDNVTLRHGTHPVFENISFAVERGRHGAILGASGSGKSTLVKALTRKIHLAQGQIWYFFDAKPRTYLHPNEVLALSAETHRAFLRQYAGYHQARWQSFEGEDAPRAGDLLETAGAGPAASALRQQLIELFQLEKLLERKILHLSFGESRKIFISRLLLRAPRLMILDDPYSGLDTESRATFSTALEQFLAAHNPQFLWVGTQAEEVPGAIEQFIHISGSQVSGSGSRPAPTPSAGPPTAPAPPILPVSGQVQQYARLLSAQMVTSPAPLVEMDAVSVTYGGVEVLKNVSWTVRAGERWALLGPNGAGKTTLLSLILADNPQAYTNTITLFGQPRGSGESIWEIKQKIGWVSSELHLYYQETDSAFEVVCSGFFDTAGLNRRCSPGQQATAAQWMEAFGMAPLAQRPFAALSSSQQRQVLLARAMVKNPPLLILDEPYQALDEQQRGDFNHLLAQLCAHTPITLIYVTHYLNQIPPFITHILRLGHGKMREQGPSPNHIS